MFSRSDSATAIFHTQIFCDQVSARLACTNKIAEIPLVKILFVTGITSNQNVLYEQFYLQSTHSSIGNSVTTAATETNRKILFYRLLSIHFVPQR